jgi:hypothetical protein
MRGSRVSGLLAKSWPPSFVFPPARGRLASIGTAATILLLVFLFVATPKSWTKSTRPSSHTVIGLRPYTGKDRDPVSGHPPSPKAESEGILVERLIVQVELEGEDTSWLQKLEPTWQNEVVTIKGMYSNLHPEGKRPDRGRIANAYLTWIIENYNHLPGTIIFIAPKNSNEHHDRNPEHAIPDLQTPFIQSSGFANLHCPKEKSRTTCNGRALVPTKPSPDLRTLEAKIPEIWKTLFGEVHLPARIATVLGAEFAVSRTQVRKRSVEEYLKYWTWLNKTIMDDDSSGLVIEYLWHIVFGKEAVFCPEKEKCECGLYSKCDGP